MLCLGNQKINLNSNLEEINQRPQGYETFFMLNSTEQEILTTHNN